MLGLPEYSFRLLIKEYTKIVQFFLFLNGHSRTDDQMRIFRRLYSNLTHKTSHSFLHLINFVGSHYALCILQKKIILQNKCISEMTQFIHWKASLLVILPYYIINLNTHRLQHILFPFVSSKIYFISSQEGKFTSNYALLLCINYFYTRYGPGKITIVSKHLQFDNAQYYEI